MMFSTLLNLGLGIGLLGAIVAVWIDILLKVFS